MNTKRLKMWILSAIVLPVLPLLAQNGGNLTNPSLTNPAGRAPGSYGNPSVTSPVGRGTVPVTSYESGLVNSPSPIDLTGNLTVTGNVGGGRHFRGPVPYNAVSDFGGTIESGTVDDFLRRATIPTDYYRGGVAPYYSQTGTVTRTIPGTQMVYVPPSSKVRNDDFRRTELRDVLYDRPQRDTAPDTTDALVSDRARFYPMDTQETDADTALAEEEIEQVKERQQRAGQRYRIEQREFTEQLEKVSDEAERLHQELGTRQLQQPDTSETLEPETTDEIERQRQLDDEDQQEEKLDVYDKMIQEYQQLEQKYNELYPDQKLGQPLPEQYPGPNMPSTDPSKRRIEFKEAPRITPEPDRREKSEQMTPGEVMARSEVALSELKTFAVYSQDKFNEHMKAAEQAMQEGRFYLATDMYSLASVYKPGDPLAYAGKSHSLFAAGEYMSSALSLKQAIDMFPGYVDFDIDLAAMLGSMDVIEQRITDIKAWIEIGDSAELKFLLAYIYMQLGRFDQARNSIDEAYERLSDVQAVKVLKNAIETRMNRR